MAIVINGSGTVTGISVGGLPDGVVDAGTLATNSVDSAELVDGAVDDSHIAAMAASKLTGALPAISGASLTGISTGIQLAGSSSGNGGTGSGSDTDMLSITGINLSNYEGKHLIVQASTCMQEDANNTNTEIIRIKLSNGSATIDLATARQGITHGSDNPDSLEHLSCFGVYEIAAAYATTCSLKVNGGMGGAFHYGDQANYTVFDGEGAGISLSYFVI